MSKIHATIPKIMGEVGAIAKTRKNTQQGYAFRGIDDAYAAFQSVFAKHGVFVVPSVLDSKREERAAKNGGVLIYTTLTVKHTFFADDASSFDCVTVGEAMDSGDKSSNKAMSAAMKYALLEVFCVPTEADNDTENHSPEPLPAGHTQEHPGGFDNAKPAPRKPAPAPHVQQHAPPSGHTMEDFLLVDYKEVSSKPGAAKPWTMWFVKFSTDDGQEKEMGTFDRKIADTLDTLKGQVVTVTYHPGRKPGTLEVLSIQPQDVIP